MMLVIFIQSRGGKPTHLCQITYKDFILLLLPVIIISFWSMAGLVFWDDTGVLHQCFVDVDIFIQMARKKNQNYITCAMGENSSDV